MRKTELFLMMLKQDGKNAAAWYLLGLEYCQLNDFGQALQAFSQALKYGDDDIKSKVMVQLGQLADIGTTGAVPEIEDTDLPLPDLTVHTAQGEMPAPAAAVPDNLVDFESIKNRTNKTENKIDIRKDIVTFADVGGLEDLKETISMKIIRPFMNPELFNRFQKKIGGGILLFGPPGCGKTFIAKATAGQCSAKFIPVRITDILDPYIGVSEQNIEAIFLNARAKRPCILFFDEIDTLGFNRAKLSSNMMRPIIDQLLTEIEGINSNTDKMLIIGATNMPWDVDAALKRPGRFDKTIFVPPPDTKARIAIFQLKLQGKPIENIDYEQLAEQTELYSGADIENVVELAAENTIRSIMSSGNDRLISMRDLLEAIEGTNPSTVEWLKTVKNYVKYSNQSGYYDDVEKFLTKHRKTLG